MAEEEKRRRDDRAYILMSTGTPDDVARAHYRRMHGAEPDRVIQTGGGTLVGPLPAGAVRAGGQGAGR